MVQIWEVELGFITTDLLGRNIISHGIKVADDGRGGITSLNIICPATDNQHVRPRSRCRG